MIVLFDGTYSKPWGRMLFADQSVIVEAPVTPKKLYGDTMRKVRSLRTSFGDRWFTSTELAQIAGVHVDEASSAIGSLHRRGDLQRERKALMRGRPGAERQRYRFVTK